MESFKVTKKIARLIVLQRIEIIGSFLKFVRKLFGRYLFTSFVTKFFLLRDQVGKKYYTIMYNEFLSFKEHINIKNYNIFLSIGGGVGGLETIINNNFPDKKYYFIERNFVSKKVRYGWGGVFNSEAYNNILDQKNFLLNNYMQSNQINIFDYDKDDLPKIKFDVIISLLSLDYHYDFDIYQKYLKEVSTPNTKIIFDTIRADYFKNIFKNIKIIRSDMDTVHKSKRLICSEFLN
ncbi:hypothetical protein N9T29_01280 [Candidatus Pelagibacter sp.]|nr:hypothetical protein [Candidatus Pelagibacter sp.]